MTYPLPLLVAERLAVLRERAVEPTEKGFGSLRGRVSAATLAAARPRMREAGFTYPLPAYPDKSSAGRRDRIGCITAL